MSAKMKLEEIVQSYESLKNICNTAKKRTKREPSFALDIIPQTKKMKKMKKIKGKRDIIDDYFDSLYQRITEHYIIELIATFEQIIFDRLDNAYGEISSILSAEYTKRRKNNKPTPLYLCTNSFIKNKENIRNLGGASKILENKISQESLDDLNEIIKYRNWFSHGKREVGEESILTFEEINQRFLTIINEID